MKKFAVLFDMDGVIVDSNPAHTVVLKDFCRKHGFELDDEDLRANIYGTQNKHWIPYLFGAITDEQLKAYADEKEALFRAYYADTIEPLAGIVDFLDALKNAAVPIAIGTSAPPENVTFTLEQTGLASYFDIILDERVVEKGKPNPEIYLKCADALDMKPEDCIVLEDSKAGVKAGWDAGCKVIGFTTTHTPEEFRHVHKTVPNFVGLGVADLMKLWE